MRKQLSRWLVGSAMVLVPALAHAEDEPKPYPECTKAPTDSETAAAKGAYQAGNASFDEADYPRAITYWEDAYRRDCTANLLLKNLARAYELYGQKRQAVVALETFLVREPNSGDKEQIQRRIEVLKKQIASEKAAPPVATGAQPPPPTAVTPPPASTDSEATLSTSSGGKRSLVPLIVAGAGVVVLVVGLAVYLPAKHDVNDFETQCPNHMCPAPTSASEPTQQELIDKANSARKKQVTGGVITTVGVAGIAGGLIWYFAQPRKPETAATRLAPAVSPGFAGVSLTGAF